jgi:putative peptidoglycan lipid II flippase
MVKRIVALFNKEISGLHEAAYLLGFFAFLSQILAILRDRLLASSFGAGEILDSYYAAFRIPDAVFVTIASLVSASIMIPLIYEKLNKDKEDARRFVSSIFSAFLLLIVFVSVLIFIFIPKIVSIIFPGFNGTETASEIIILSRIMVLQPILLGISNFIAGITQTFRKFFVYALSPIFYNLGIIIGVVFFYPIFGVTGLAFGVVLGALLHLLIQIPALHGTNLSPFLTLKINWQEAFSVIKISLPRTIGLAANNLSTLALVTIGSLIGAGSISIFTLALNLQSVPLTIVGASYSMAAFPTLSKLFSVGKNEEYLSSIKEAMRHIIFWSIPALVFFIVLRAQIVRTVLGAGEFNWDDTRLTAAALALFVFSLLAQNLTTLFVRSYYAQGKTKTPLLMNLLSAVFIVLSSFVLVKFFEANLFFRSFIESILKVSDTPGTIVLMLPLGFTLGSIINLLIYWVAFNRQFKNFP